MSYCRFENRLANDALEMQGLAERIEVRHKYELEPALAAIETAQREGRWVALLLDYELGEWLVPGHPPEAAPDTTNRPPRLTALIFNEARHVPVWQVPDAPPPVLQATPLISRERYLDDIQALREGIARGDYYQVNYTFGVQVHSPLPPRELYRRLAGAHPSAHAAYIEDGERRILSLSPELFVRREGRRLTVRPMKGTAPRMANPDDDIASGQALLNSTKNRAENLMIVDLLRNDLGRLATPGSVSVDALFTLERYPSVWTLTSTIHADCPDLALLPLLEALFPCGSITGAPKLAAMKAIQALENRRRGIYCGSIGWLAPDGDLSLNVAIRTLEFTGGQPGLFSVGGGIVHDSDPLMEWQECLWKGRIIGLKDTTA